MQHLSLDQWQRAFQSGNCRISRQSIKFKLPFGELRRRAAQLSSSGPDSVVMLYSLRPLPRNHRFGAISVRL